ncbi:MAG TPA: hypothetical protein VGD66_15205 [Allosphingosinicella sp.]|jgi:hypothetical protein
MTVSYDVKLQPSHDLDYLNQEIVQSETLLGPLTAIGNNGSLTVLSFKLGDPPANNAIIARQNAGKPVIPTGAKLVASGSVFIAGEMALCAATRAQPAAKP